MNVTEFSEQWDILYNNIASNAAPGLTEYEKSVFLTQAQKEVVLGLYNGNLGYGFEQVEENRKYLSPLVRTVELKEDDIVVADNYIGLTSTDPRFKNSTFFMLPKDLWFITYESANVFDKNNKCISEREFDVTPVTQDMYHKVRENPFRGANDRRILRLDVEPVSVDDDTESVTHVVELVSKYDIDSYLVRYIRHPHPIILENLDKSGLSIEGETDTQTSELNPILHKIILEIAINKAYNIRPN